MVVLGQNASIFEKTGQTSKVTLFSPDLYPCFKVNGIVASDCPNLRHMLYIAGVPSISDCWTSL